MYGMVNRAIEEMVERSHGAEVWERVKARAGVDVEVFISSEGYPDDISYRLMGAASEELGEPVDTLLERLGGHWILQTARYGYGDLMAAGGETLTEFLLNLPEFHSRMSTIFPHLQPPQFEVDRTGERSVRVHYYSERQGLTALMTGLLRGLGEMYSAPVQVALTAAKSQGADHDEFSVSW
jgi:hypothetical protein